ncbi:MAG: hypothetical protein ABSH09_16090 [Bryobacteraceae bacterium]|jgi:hypothetical protein
MLFIVAAPKHGGEAEAAGRDHERVLVPTGYVNQAQLGDIIAQAAKNLGPEVAHVAYGLGPDSTDLTGRIAAALFDAIRPIENWGLRPYLNFRSRSEQDRRPDPDWI